MRPYIYCCFLVLLLLNFAAPNLAQNVNEEVDDDKIEIGDEHILSASARRDEIRRKLPGVNFDINFKHYSGYFKVSSKHFLHYWFVTSQNDPAKDPLVFWFNGGPGCSSMEGLLAELGPYLVNEDGKTLRQNPYAWNKNASVVFLESPAGVGFSYTTDGNMTTGDDQTAQENYEAIKQFFGRHPSYRNHNVFITGESYAGIYVPMVTALVLDGQRRFPINLKGMAIGNGYMHADIDLDATVKFSYYHGLVDERVWDTLARNCCGGCIEHCKMSKLQGECAEIVRDIEVFKWHGGLNPYDMYQECAVDDDSEKFQITKLGLSHKMMQNRLQNVPIKKKPLKAVVGKKSITPCSDDYILMSYLNMKKVRRVLHIPKKVAEWKECNNEVFYHYQKERDDMSPFVTKIVRAKIPTLLYYGDTDMACNFMLGQQFSAQLGFKLTKAKEPWHLGGQIGGFKTIYEDGLFTFLTVRGTGHMVPQWRPVQAEYMFKQFLNNEPYGEN